jgi:hypothetical protein
LLCDLPTRDLHEPKTQLTRMSTLNTPLSGLEKTPVSTLSFPSTPLSVSPSPLPSSARRTGHSASLLALYSTQDRVILDIGARFIQAGFSGEPFPRCTIESRSQVFWEQQDWDAGLIEDRLERALRHIYSQYFSFRCLLI